MTTMYIDFDNTIVESNRRIIELLNERYNLLKTEDDLLDYGYKSIVPITEQEKISLFESDDFFSNLKFKDGFLKVLDKYYSKDIKFIIVTKGTSENLIKKTKWIKENIPYDIEVIGITNEGLSKNKVNMLNGIQIDDCTKALDTNAQLKILYKSGNNYEWQKGYENTDIIVVNSWQEIDEILSFFTKYDYKTLNKL